MVKANHAFSNSALVGTPLYKPNTCAAQKGRVFAAFWSENRYRPCLFWSGYRVWFLRELRECMNVFIISVKNDYERKKDMQIRTGFKEIVCVAVLI